MKKLSIILILLAMTLAAVSTASGTTYLNWIGEFSSGFHTCQVTNSTGQCYVEHHWGDEFSVGDVFANSTWSYAGAQGISAAGRATAVEKVQSSYSDRSTQHCGNVSTYLSRYRTIGAIPSEGASCSSGTQQFVGSVAYTYSSCSAGVQHYAESHRLLPAMDFSAESGVAGTVGYRSRIMSYESVYGAFGWRDGCYKIKWF